MSDYDSRPETYAHISEVRWRLLAVAHEMIERAHRHDASKLVAPELAAFDEWTPKLGGTAYGSLEYKTCLKGLGVGLEHHYATNDHHPEHFTNGVQDMDLVQVIEMLADWKAATLRHADGDLSRSITQNSQRFGYGEEFEGLLRRTAERFGWLS